MKATIITQPTTEPPPVTIQITATPLQLAVIAEVLKRGPLWSRFPGDVTDWENLYDSLRNCAGPDAVEKAVRIYDEARG